MCFRIRSIQMKKKYTGTHTLVCVYFVCDVDTFGRNKINGSKLSMFVTLHVCVLCFVYKYLYNVSFFDLTSKRTGNSQLSISFLFILAIHFVSFLLLQKHAGNGKLPECFSLSFVRVQWLFLFSMSSKLELSIWMHYNNVLENVCMNGWMDSKELSAVGFFITFYSLCGTLEGRKCIVSPFWMHKASVLNI